MATRSRGGHPSSDDVSTTERLKGRVVFWRASFGFIEAPGRGDWFFAHQADLVDAAQLEPGQRVRFAPTATAKGPRALAVEVLSGPAAAERSGR